MANFKTIAATSVLAFGLSPGISLAEVTATEVWENWRDMSASMGQELTAANVATSGGTVTVTGLAISMEMPDFAVSGTIDLITFAEQGNGSVLVTMSETYPVSFSGTSPEGDEFNVDMTFIWPGLTTIVSGDVNQMVYAIAGPEISVSIDNVDGGKGPMQDLGTITLSGLSATYTLGSGDVRDFTATISAAGLDAAIAVSEPGGPGRFVLDGAFGGLNASYSGSLPAMADYSDMGAMLDAGFDVVGNYNLGAGTFAMNFSDGSDTMSMNGSSASAAVDVAIGPEGLIYDVGYTGAEISMSGSQMPIPQVDISAEEIAFGLTMPVAEGTTPQDAGLLVKLVGLSVNDMIWMMADPGGVLPHDPATLVIDLSGKANWLFDIFDPEAAEKLDGMPGEVHALTINELYLSIAGAEVNGTGDFTFDNSDLTTWDGIPAPDGSLYLNVAGAQGLMGKLVQMGLIPQEQMMQANMMLSLFSKPGPEPDTLESEIKVTKDGQLFANGMQLK